MAAATENRDTPEIVGRKYQKVWTVADAAILYAGVLAAADYTDEVQPGADTAGLRILGRAPAKVDNTDDGETCEVEHGVFRYDNSSSNPVVRSAIGLPCYAEDDQTVAAKTTNFVSAGLVYDVDDDGVWVDQRHEALAAALARRPVGYALKQAAYTVTAAQAYEGRTVFAMDGNAGGAVELTLPTAVGGMRVGVFRVSTTAADDVTVQAATGDKIEASDGYCAAGKQIDNTVDSVSGVLWLVALDDTNWAAENRPNDFASWVKNDA